MSCHRPGALLALLWSAWIPAHGMTAQQQQWLFDVYLDGDEIGYHRFTLTQGESGRELHSEARFTVRFLSIPVYRYSHDAREYWDGDCLRAIESSTNDNGEQLSLYGRVDNGQFRLRSDDRQQSLEGCIMSFAYWDKRILQAERLLNAQNGEYTRVLVKDLGVEPLLLADSSVTAQRYRLSGEDLRIDLWYSPDRQWLGLQSTLPSGRVLTYRRQSDDAS